MDWLQALILALVQGLTEYLPISSSAHLILSPYLFGFADQGLDFDVAVHLGSLLAVGMAMALMVGLYVAVTGSGVGIMASPKD